MAGAYWITEMNFAHNYHNLRIAYLGYRGTFRVLGGYGEETQVRIHTLWCGF